MSCILLLESLFASKTRSDTTGVSYPLIVVQTDFDDVEWDEFRISFWIYLTNEARESNRRTLMWLNEQSSSSLVWLLCTEGDGTISLYERNSWEPFMSTTTPVPINQWLFLSLKSKRTANYSRLKIFHQDVSSPNWSLLLLTSFHSKSLPPLRTSFSFELGKPPSKALLPSSFPIASFLGVIHKAKLESRDSLTLTTPTIPPSFPPYTYEGPPHLAAPLTSVHELLGWHRPFVTSPTQLVTTIPLCSRTSCTSKVKVIHCHDMKGGYSNDSDLQSNSEFELAYNFRYWQYIDYFIYFSHQRVTIPPRGWTDCSHRNGVHMLGTFITEWDAGEKENDILLKEPNLEKAVENLVGIAVWFGFDGWFINIETKLDSKWKVERMLLFVSLLTKRMHETLPGSLVVWYDSVTIEGELKWQNSLNKKNKPFFDVCDGIFLNYAWTPELIESSAKLAGERRYDVFTGIDIFGRGTYGGGMFNTHEGLRVINEMGTSIALFAPGWTMEVATVGCKREKFDGNETAFWTGRRTSQELFDEEENSQKTWRFNETLEDRAKWDVICEKKGIYGTSFEWREKVKTFSFIEKGFSSAFLDESPDITISEIYKGRGPKFDDFYSLTVTLLDENDQPLDIFETGELRADKEGKEIRVDHKFSSYGVGLRKLRWSHKGKDVECWAGSYGTVIGPSSLIISGAQESPSVATYVRERKVACSYLPFSMTFNQGTGKKFFIDGRQVYSSPWYSMSLQDIQPTYWNQPFKSSSKSKVGMSLCYDQALDGGSCVLFAGISLASFVTCFHFLETFISVPSSSLSVEFAVQEESGSLGFLLEFQTPALTPGETPGLFGVVLTGLSHYQTEIEEAVSSEKEFTRLQFITCPSTTRSLSNNWRKLGFFISTSEEVAIHLVRVSVLCIPNNDETYFTQRLGSLRIASPLQVPPLTPCTSLPLQKVWSWNLNSLDKGHNSFDLTVSWEAKQGKPGEGEVVCHDIFEKQKEVEEGESLKKERKWLGRTTGNSFVIRDIQNPETFEVEVEVQ